MDSEIQKKIKKIQARVLNRISYEVKLVHNYKNLSLQELDIPHIFANGISPRQKLKDFVENILSMEYPESFRLEMIALYERDIGPYQHKKADLKVLKPD